MTELTKLDLPHVTYKIHSDAMFVISNSQKEVNRISLSRAKFHAVRRYVVLLHSTKINLVQVACFSKTHGDTVLRSYAVMLLPRQKFQRQSWYDWWQELKVRPYKSDVVSKSIKFVWHFVEFWRLIQTLLWDRHTNTMILQAIFVTK